MAYIGVDIYENLCLSKLEFSLKFLNLNTQNSQ